jgi:hypothetical protein
MLTVLFLAAVALFGLALIRESARPDFVTRPSGTLLDGFTRPYRLPNHPLFGERGPVVLKAVGICLASIGFIGLFAFVLRHH